MPDSNSNNNTNDAFLDEYHEKRDALLGSDTKKKVDKAVVETAKAGKEKSKQTGEIVKK